MNRNLLRLGFVLILLAFLTGLVIPLFKNPHLGVSTHLNAIFGGIILVIISLISGYLNLSNRMSKIMSWSWIYAVYMNWFATLLGAIWGTSKLTPVAGEGFSAPSLQETVVSILLVSLVIASFVGCVIVLWGLRGEDNSV